MRRHAPVTPLATGGMHGVTPATWYGGGVPRGLTVVHAIMRDCNDGGVLLDGCVCWTNSDWLFGVGVYCVCTVIYKMIGELHLDTIIVTTLFVLRNHEIPFKDCCSSH